MSPLLRVQRHPMGHRPDAPGLPIHVGAHVGAVLYSATPTPPEVTLTLPARLNQQTNTCTGCATLTACLITAAAHGIPAPPPLSYVSPYDWGRCLELVAMGTPDAPLEDHGAVPSFVMQGLTDVGIASLASRPEDLATINVKPDLAEIEDASTFRLVGWSRVDATDAERTMCIRSALAHGFAVVLAVQVDDAFEAGVGILGPPSGQIHGGHYVCLYGYRTIGTETIFKVVNSWGYGWGDNGCAEMSEEAIMAASDLYVMSVRAVGA